MLDNGGLIRYQSFRLFCHVQFIGSLFTKSLYFLISILIGSVASKIDSISNYDTSNSTPALPGVVRLEFEKKCFPNFCLGSLSWVLSLLLPLYWILSF